MRPAAGPGHGSCVPLCLAALTSLTCNWVLEDTDSIQCTRLGHLHLLFAANLNPLPSTLTSLSLKCIQWQFAHDNEDHLLKSQQFLVHICFTALLSDLSSIPPLAPLHLVVATSVTSVELTFRPSAFSSPGYGGSIAGQHFRHLWAWFSYLQRLHIHLHDHMVLGRQDGEEVVISAAWLPAHCRLVVTHKLTCPVSNVKGHSGCLSLPLSSCPC